MGDARRTVRGGTGRAAWLLIVLTVGAVRIAGVAEAQVHLEPSDGRFWITGVVATMGAALFDERLRALAADHQTAGLDRLARDVDPLGRARYLVPSLIGGIVLPRLLGERPLSDAAIRVGLGYAAADGLESVLKPVVGRHRPDDRGRPDRFRPFHVGSGGSWDSFPSAHTTHAFALAAGIATEAHHPWVAALAYGVAATVGLQRVYTQAHWASDVVGSTVLAIATSTTTVAWLERRTGRN